MSAAYGLIGHPIAQSLSPLIHNGWMSEHGLEGAYEAIDVAPGAFEASLETLSRDGAQGLNITAPHKHAALAAATTSSETAQRIGAANTLIRRGADWHAENTDAPGFGYTLKAANIEAAGRRFGLIGAGGAARGVVEALTAMGASVHVFNRTPSKAAALTSDFPNVTHSNHAFDGSISAAEEFDALINTASFGFDGVGLTLPEGDGRLFYDISYGKAAAPAISAARNAGWSAMDGLPMLVAQAAYSFEHWFGIFPDTTSALARCRAAGGDRVMIILGLTGSIGMGKSATAGLFRDEEVPVYDADAAVHALYDVGGVAVEPLETAFPGVAVDGRIDRPTLRARVLDDDAAMKLLESIVHPLVGGAQLEFRQTATASGSSLAVLDIPLLYETSGERYCDFVAVVTAPAAVQRARVLARADMTAEAFEAILERQVPDAEKRARADFVISTAHGFDYARDHVQAIVRLMQRHFEEQADA